jgi:histidine triad (HIT) family protein
MAVTMHERIIKPPQLSEASETVQKDVFCLIVEHKETAIRVFETDKASVILDINGGYPLVLSKDHSEENIPEILSLAGKLQPLVKKVYGADGIKILLNLGRAAGQEIPHPHVHIIPRQLQGDFGKNIVVTDFGERSKLQRKLRVLSDDLIPYPYKRNTRS